MSRTEPEGNAQNRTFCTCQAKVSPGQRRQADGRGRKGEEGRNHFRKPARCNYVPGVYKPIEMPRRLFNLFSHVVLTLKIELVSDQVQRVLIILHFRLQASQVEAVRQVFLINLTKVFVAARRDEL